MLKCAISGAKGVLGKKITNTLPYKFYPLKEKIENFNKVNKWINQRKYDLVIHLAAIVPTKRVSKNYKKAKSVNIKGTKNIVKAVLNTKYPPKWFFYASTSHVYLTKFRNKKISEKSTIKPYSKYGKTKREGEKIIEKNFKNKKTKFCIGRIFSFTDKNQKKPFVIPSLVEKIKKSSDTKIIINNIDHYRDFLPTKDIALAIKVLFNKKCSGIYNIGSGKKINLKNIALMIAKKNKKKIYFKKDSKTTYLISDINKIKNLGWKPRKFKKNMEYFY